MKSAESANIFLGSLETPGPATGYTKDALGRGPEGEYPELSGQGEGLPGQTGPARGG
jgi:hypothetical protein